MMPCREALICLCEVLLGFLLFLFLIVARTISRIALLGQSLVHAAKRLSIRKSQVLPERCNSMLRVEYFEYIEYGCGVQGRSGCDFPARAMQCVSALRGAKTLPAPPIRDNPQRSHDRTIDTPPRGS